MSYSTLFKLGNKDLGSEAEVETRLLPKIFAELGYPDVSIVPKKNLPALTVNEGSRKRTIEADFLLLGSDNNAKVIVEAKDPTKNVQDAWGQAASYALAFNSDKENDSEKVKWLLISNGYITSLYRWDSNTPTVTLQISDFASGSPALTALKSYIKHKTADLGFSGSIKFEVVSPEELNKIFAKCHDLIWKREKMNPTDAFFEFCKFIFIKIQEDKKRSNGEYEGMPGYKVPMTLEWLEAQLSTSKHPVREVLFLKLRESLENLIRRNNKKRIFETNETLKISASTTKELIRHFEHINLSSIDEDLNGRMFEVFLNAAVRGRALGQYFTPRSVVDFMTRISLWDKDVSNPPTVIDACSGTAGFLIEVMAYLLSGLREDTRFNEREKDQIKSKICNESLYGIEANERVARIARINMYLHGDGGSHIFHGDGLDNDPVIEEDMSDERKSEVESHRDKVKPEMFDIVLTNPPFSMTYERKNEDEKRLLAQREIANGLNTAKSNLLFLDRYHELLKAGGQLLIVLDDTILNGSKNIKVREWILENFIILGIHSLPFNAFFKAKANIKTSIIHLRKKLDKEDGQGHVFMSISNNIGHNNALEDTPDRNNLTDILMSYLEWKRTGTLSEFVKENNDPKENLECPEQVWLVRPEDIKAHRLDAFYYSPELSHLQNFLNEQEKSGKIDLLSTSKIPRRSKLTKEEKANLTSSKELLKYIEISDVTKYGLITTYIEDTFDKLPSRGEYRVRTGDVLLAINNSSRGTVVLVPEEFDGAICTSGFLVLQPNNEEMSYMLWYVLRSEYSRKQIYYLAQTASQPELKIDAWKKEFLIPIPNGESKKLAIDESRMFHGHLVGLLKADVVRFV